VGSLVKQDAKFGIFITTSAFTKAAEIYVSDLNKYEVLLISGDEFVGHMIDFEIGIQSISTYQVNAIDYEFFDEKYIPKARIW
jgi:restriction system protein